VNSARSIRFFLGGALLASPLLASPLCAQTPTTLSTRLHGNAFGMYVNQNTIRKAEDVVAVGWLMGEAAATRGSVELGLTAMVSLDPITLGDCGYPRLLAGAGQLCVDHPFQDLTHPHAFFMELTARARLGLGAVTLFGEGGPVGEPALGPTSYLHRASSMYDPLAPMSHHETHPAHVANGVATGGISWLGLTLEASAFNARPGDDEAYDLDLGSLSSWSTRAQWAGGGWTLQGSAGELRDAGDEHAAHAGGGSVRIYSASAEQTLMRGFTMVDWTAAWVRHAGGELPVDAFLLEASAQRGRHNLFARAERVHRVEQEVEVVITPSGEHAHTVTNFRRRVGEIAGGYSFRLLSRRGIDLLAGGRAGLSFIPTDYFTVYYGTPHGRSLSLFVNVQPTRAHVH
jgi:hypothetical protein